jgi:DNA-binding transcriptional regulator LsrR (DeoR family)
MKRENRKQMLADISTLYYKEKETQAQIAKRFGYSRSAISRLLIEAEQEGIIDININYPLLRDAELERSLKEKFQLEAAYVINTGQATDQQALQMVGQMGALFLEQELRNEMVVGIGWGTSLHALVNALPDLDHSNIRVVQVIGALGSKSDARIDGPDLAASLAGKLNADHQFLHSPCFLDSPEACLSLRSQKQIRDTLDLAYQADLILLGIGTIDVDPRFSSLYRTGLLSQAEILKIQKNGGVSNFCGVMVGENGEILELDINRRVLAVDLHELKKHKRRMIGIASGGRKSGAILAVLKGGWLDVLITNQAAVKTFI